MIKVDNLVINLLLAILIGQFKLVIVQEWLCHTWSDIKGTARALRAIKLKCALTHPRKVL